MSYTIRTNSNHLGEVPSGDLLDRPNLVPSQDVNHVPNDGEEFFSAFRLNLVPNHSFSLFSDTFNGFPECPVIQIPKISDIS